jgi:hypothetical protein
MNETWNAVQNSRADEAETRSKCLWRVTRFRYEVTVEWRNLRNEEINDLYSSPNIVRVIKSRRVRWAWHVARTGERRGVYRVLVGRQLRRPRRRWEDSIKMDHQHMGCGAWTGLIWLRVGTGGGHLWMRQWTCGFHKTLGISWLAENQLASPEGLCSME